MSRKTYSSRKFLIAAGYASALILFASVAWQPMHAAFQKSGRLSGPTTQTAFLMERFGNPQRAQQ